MSTSWKIELSIFFSFEVMLHKKRGNPKECDTRLCIHFFGKNLVNPRIATHKPCKVHM